MENNYSNKLNYNEPIELGEGVYWVGFIDDKDSLRCNPYLIVEGDEAVLIDGGSRSDFSTVMMKILQTGIDPSIIQRLIYQHYDPDLCGSISNFEEVIGNKNLKILSHSENNVFIKHYSVSSPLTCITNINYEYKFKTGRTLKFIQTPYAHSSGSFITYDEKSGTLFTSDIFGSCGMQRGMFLKLDDKCTNCDVYSSCPNNNDSCPIESIFYFQKKIMTSVKALRLALSRIKKISAKIIAPQHGSIINNREDIANIIGKLELLEDVGIDGYDGEIEL